MLDWPSSRIDKGPTAAINDIADRRTAFYSGTANVAHPGGGQARMRFSRPVFLTSTLDVTATAASA